MILSYNKDLKYIFYLNSQNSNLNFKLNRVRLSVIFSLILKPIKQLSSLCLRGVSSQRLFLVEKQTLHAGIKAILYTKDNIQQLNIIMKFTDLNYL